MPQSFVVRYASRVVGWVAQATITILGPFNSDFAKTCVERFIAWLVRYPLLTGQVLFYLLVAWGIVGSEVGLTDLFWHDFWFSQFVVGSATCWLFGVVVFVNYLLHVPKGLPDKPTEVPWGPDGKWSLFPSGNPGVRCVGMRVLWWLLGLLALTCLGKLIALGWSGPFLKNWSEIRDFGVWFVIGYIASLFLAYLISLIDGKLGLRDEIAEQQWLEHVGPDLSPNQRQTLRLLHGMGAFIGLIIFLSLLFWIALSSYLLLSPIVSLSIELILLDVVIGFIAFRLSSPLLLVATFLVLVVCVNLWGGGQMTFPEITPENNHAQLSTDHTPKPDLIQSEDLLRKFFQVRSKPGAQPKAEPRKPRLVMVATSGGGIRASVWMAVVLKGLERGPGEGAPPDPNIRDHIRVIAGASGGMVAAGAHVADREWGLQPSGFDPDTETGLPRLARALGRDSLSPTIQTLLLSDLNIRGLFPAWTKWDRGQSLQLAWNKNFTEHERINERLPDFKPWESSPFAVKFRDLQGDEQECKRPSLIFSPMFVEDSKRLLISNLDLQPLTRPNALRLDPPGYVYDPERMDRPTAELFRLFDPVAVSELTVGTAARMNASFPVLSPAVPLPGTPMRRPVDAGYFDNYGVDMIAQWIMHNRDAIETHTSGVLLIQIRAYPLEQDGIAIRKIERSPLELIVGAVSAPLEAVLTARGLAAFHRNSELVDILDNEFNRRKKRTDFFTTATFELDGKAALSWYLTDSQKRDVAKGWYENSNGKWIPKDARKQQVEAIYKWLGHDGCGPK